MLWLTACQRLGTSFNRKEEQKRSLRLSHLELVEQGFVGFSISGGKKGLVQTEVCCSYAKSKKRQLRWWGRDQSEGKMGSVLSDRSLWVDQE